MPAAGLTSAQVAAARERGETNAVPSATSRRYWAILRANLFTLFNNFLYAIGLALLVMGRPKDAVVSVGLGLLNSLIGSIQEVRAKQKLDRLRLLHRAPCRVVRDGAEQEVTPEQVVRGDLLHVAAGDQIVVDGPVTTGYRLEVDESPLTGESEPVPKRIGDRLHSGTVVLGGSAYQTAEVVGADSTTGALTVTAKAWKLDPTPMQWRIDAIVRLIMLTVALMSAAVLANAGLKGLTLVEVVQTAAVLSGLVPYGLFFLITISYAVGAAAIARRGALIQQISAVESLCSVDVLCTDKTGTLTTGRMHLDRVATFDGRDPETVGRLLGTAVDAMTTRNHTVVALAQALPGSQPALQERVPFSPQRRWSGVAGSGGGYVLGAVEALDGALSAAADLRMYAVLDDLTRHGLRVLLFAATADADADFFDTDGMPVLPALTPLALVALRDELRDGVGEALADLRAEGVEIKVISGDDPRTVAAIGRCIGLDGGDPATGADLEAMTPAAFDDAVLHGTVFGRVAPRTKERMLGSLRRQGRYTAMIGDGVNDIPSLKRAHVGVALAGGNSVTCDIADIVLLDDSFDALAPAQRQGRRIVTGIATSMYLYLARVSTSILIIVGVAILGLGFPYEPAQVALVLFTVGLPTMLLTAWAEPEPPNPHLIGSLARFVVPAAVVTALFGVTVYAILYQFVMTLPDKKVPDNLIARFEEFTGLLSTNATFTEQTATVVAQTGLTVFTSFAAFLLILFLKPPARVFASWTPVERDKRPALLVGALITIFFAILATPALADYFGLLPDFAAFMVAGMALPLWFLLLSAVWRFDLLSRMTGFHRPAEWD
ncbi:HAD-IC family P-type ATPase [Actinoplanes sp. M2I2]|uniref:HAD-IC family P-type ATPase n=1 Tax=Actinoplanes sp. M2I2 TaxID=1734444 RepID=UPI0020209C83|nr:HAD-IC family P-type ATPase [Actinoplanes sp. M2I2]